MGFASNGFMTAASPDCNDGWRVHVDSEVPFYRLRINGEERLLVASLQETAAIRVVGVIKGRSWTRLTGAVA